MHLYSLCPTWLGLKTLLCRKQNDRYIMPDYVSSDNHLQPGYQIDNTRCDTVCKQGWGEIGLRAGGGGGSFEPRSRTPPPSGLP